MTDLIIGEGFQQWIADHQATPLGNELYFSAEMSVLMVAVADAQGNKQHVMLFYNKPTNEIIPFVQATL